MSRAAYLIGVPEYDADEFQDLPAVRNDLIRMAQALESSGYVVRSHPESPVSLGRNKIMAAIRKLARESTANLLLIYFSGHGVHIDGRDYMVPHDAPGDDDALAEYLISWDNLSDALDEAEASAILLVADVCREGVETEVGADSKGLGGFSRKKKERIKGRNVVRIYSCAPAELSWISHGPNGLSHFTEAFAEAMDASSPPRFPQAIMDFVQVRLDAICAENNHPRQELRYDSPGGLRSYGLPAIEIAEGTEPTPTSQTLPQATAEHEALSALDFSELIDGYTKTRNFVGRKWLLTDVDTFLASREHRYLVITGEPGIGKSAFSAHLTQQRTIHAYHFCRARQAESFSPAGFVESMSAQLTLNLPGFEPARQTVGTESQSSQDLLSRLLIQPLRAWTKDNPKTQVVLLVDSLDEAERHAQPNIVDLIKSTEGLPLSVRWLLTSRPNSRAQALPGACLAILDSSKTNQDDIREFVTTTLAAAPFNNLLPGTKARIYQETLTRKSEGNFLYLTYVFDHIIEDIEKGLPLPEPDKLPNGLAGVYRDFLDRFIGPRFDDLWERKLFPVLQVLTVALDALTMEQISRLSGLSRQRTGRALEDLDQFLDLTDGDREAYRIFHTSFTDFLTDRKLAGPFWIDPIDAHAKIAEVCLKTGSTDWRQADDYSRRNLPRHLAAGVRGDDLPALLFNYNYLQARVERKELTPLLDDFALAADDPEAALLASSLRMSSHILRLDPNQLASQLFGRQSLPEAGSLKGLLRDAAASTTGPWLRPLRPCLTSPGGALLMTLTGHERWVTSVAITPDGERIVSGSYDKTLRIWNSRTGECLVIFYADADIMSCAVSMNDIVVASDTQGRMMCFKLERGSGRSL